MQQALHKSLKKRFFEKLSLWTVLLAVPVGSFTIPLILWFLPVKLMHQRKWKWQENRIGNRLSMFLLEYPLRCLIFMYLMWCWIFDRATALHGGRPFQSLRKSRIWNYFRSYFSMSVIHDGFIDPSPGKLYVFGAHPHGVLSAGVWGNLISHNPHALPDSLNYRVLTISLNFKVPIWRELVMGVGMVDASRESVQYLLRRGISVVIVVGGAEEALDARPRTFDLTLDSRQGFVRLALEYGASLVPALSFGETDIFEQVMPNPPGSLVRQFQEYLKETFGYSVPLVRGRLFLGLPLRRPITTVFGKPIPVPKIPHPSAIELRHYHELYRSALEDLYERYRSDVYPVAHKPLRVVDQIVATAPKL